MKIMVTSSRNCYTQSPHPAAGHCWPTPPPETPEHSWASKGQSLVGSLLLSLGFWCTPGLFVPSKSLFPSNTVSLIEKLLFLFSCQVMSNSSRPHGLQHTRLPCPSTSPGVYRSSFPLNWWCLPTVSCFVDIFSFFLQSFPASGSFPMSSSQLLVSVSCYVNKNLLYEIKCFQIHLSFSMSIWAYQQIIFLFI